MTNLLGLKFQIFGTKIISDANSNSRGHTHYTPNTHIITIIIKGGHGKHFFYISTVKYQPNFRA